MSWALFFRSLDAVTLTAVFIFQNVALNMIFIRGLEEFTSWSYIWFLVDLLVLLTFYLTLYAVGSRALEARKKKKEEEQEVRPVSSPAALNLGGCDGSINDSIASGPLALGTGEQRAPQRPCYRGNGYAGRKPIETPTKNFPMVYVCWIFYGVILICKIVLLFMMGIAQELKHEDFFGPQMLKFAIGISALMFTLVVAAHKNSKTDPMRNAYLNNLCYRVALEILDSASFLSLLLPSESHIVYPFLLENIILFLASLNLFLPCMTLYKLCSSDFGRKAVYPVDIWYKFLHVIVIDGTFFAVRLYLWSMFSADTSIFMIKNMYSIMNFGRDLPKDFKDCKSYCCGEKPEMEVELGGRDLARILGGDAPDMIEDDDDDDISMDFIDADAIQLKNLREGRARTANWNNKRDRSISTRGMHGSAQSSIVQVYAITEVNGHAGVGAVSSSTVVPDESNSQMDLEEEDSNSALLQDDGTQTSAGSTATAASSGLEEVPVRLRGSKP